MGTVSFLLDKYGDHRIRVSDLNASSAVQRLAGAESQEREGWVQRQEQ